MYPSKSKHLAAYLNSCLVSAYLFLTASTWGIERDRLLLDEETMQLPSPFETISEEQKVKIIALYGQLCEKRARMMHTDTTEEERNAWMSCSTPSSNLRIWKSRL